MVPSTCSLGGTPPHTSALVPPAAEGPPGPGRLVGPEDVGAAIALGVGAMGPRGRRRRRRRAVQLRDEELWRGVGASEGGMGGGTTLAVKEFLGIGGSEGGGGGGRKNAWYSTNGGLFLRRTGEPPHFSPTTQLRVQEVRKTSETGVQKALRFRLIVCVVRRFL